MNIIGWPDICQPNQPKIISFSSIFPFFPIFTHLYMIWHLKAFKMFLLYYIILGIEVLSCTTCLMLIHKISWVCRFSSLGILVLRPYTQMPSKKKYLLQKSFPLKKVPLANGWNKVECASWILCDFVTNFYNLL